MQKLQPIADDAKPAAAMQYDSCAVLCVAAIPTILQMVYMEKDEPAGVISHEKVAGEGTTNSLWAVRNRSWCIARR